MYNKRDQKLLNLCIKELKAAEVVGAKERDKRGQNLIRYIGILQSKGYITKGEEKALYAYAARYNTSVLDLKEAVEDTLKKGYVELPSETAKYVDYDKLHSWFEDSLKWTPPENKNATWRFKLDEKIKEDS